MKTYKNIDELIEYLKENKKIIVRDEDREAFNERSYLSLINPYKDLYAFGKNEEGKRIYKNEVDFNEFLQLARLDDEFSELMYRQIGVFEKKFKHLLFDEICKKYASSDVQDYTCTSYVEEIDNFLNGVNNEVPKFCPNYYKLLTKNGYIDDQYDLERKKSLLEYILEIGTGKSKMKAYAKSNKLIRHYIKTQGLAPLWSVSNALTLGELNLLFSMLDSYSQRRIISLLYEEKEERKISIRKIVSFCGLLESIRRMRNVVNHYEPIFPYLVNEVSSKKQYRKSRLKSVFNLLDETYYYSNFIEKKNDKIIINENQYNKKSLFILSIMNRVKS